MYFRKITLGILETQNGPRLKTEKPVTKTKGSNGCLTKESDRRGRKKRTDLLQLHPYIADLRPKFSWLQLSLY